MTLLDKECANPLTIEIKDDKLIISIGIDTLVYAAEHSEIFNSYKDNLKDWSPDFIITDKQEFAKGVLNYLQEELGDDGSTIITMTIENAFESAIEGAYGVDQLDGDGNIEL